MTFIKINENKIKESIILIEGRKSIGDKAFLDKEALGRGYLYLNQLELFIKYMTEASKLIETHIQAMRNKGFADTIGKALQIKANYYRLMGQTDSAHTYYLQAKDAYQKALVHVKDEARKDVLTQLSEVLCMLGKYEEAITIGQKAGEDLVSVQFAQARLQENNPDLLENIIAQIAKVKRSTPMGTGALQTMSPWDWYDLCLYYLGQPSRMQAVENYIK